MKGEVSPSGDGRIFTFEGSEYPLISTRKNGDRLIGYANTEAAEDLYAAGTPPVHGLSAKGVRSNRVAGVRIGQQLTIERRDDHWFVSDAHGELGDLRWALVMKAKTMR